MVKYLWAKDQLHHTKRRRVGGRNDINYNLTAEMLTTHRTVASLTQAKRDSTLSDETFFFKVSRPRHKIHTFLFYTTETSRSVPGN